MHADVVEHQSDIDTVIDQELSPMDRREPMHFLRKTDQIARREIALAKLDGTHTSRQCARQNIEQRASTGLLTIRNKQETASKGRH